jgi:hypothetical protein
LEDEPNKDIHPKLRFLPPFICEFLLILIVIALIYKVANFFQNP